MITIFETERYLLKTNGPKLGQPCFICKQGDACFECVRQLRPLRLDPSITIEEPLNFKAPVADKWVVESNTGNFEKFVFPIIRQTWPKLVAADFVDFVDSAPYIYLCGDVCISMYAMSYML